MSYPVYKLIHFLGIFMVIAALVAAGIHVLRGGTRANDPYRKLLSAAHGIAVFLILLGGFGMLARLGIMSGGGGLPGWIILKLVIWVAVGALMALPYRGPKLARVMLVALPLLLLGAAATALYKP